MYRNYLKRLMDIVLSFIGSVLLSWLVIVIGVLVKCTSKGPVLFKQKRIGINKSEFYILKFRTMRIDTPKDMPTHMLADPKRFITPLGSFLRKTSLDELPQLWNILCGDMSVVGPRPALWNQDDLVAERDKYGANSVRPGLTGLAQVSGRDELPIPIKAKYDGDYVENITMLGDAKLIFRTVFSVIFGKGIKEGK